MFAVMIFVWATVASAEPSQREIDAQYAAVLSAMKNPVTTGVLVTEIGPDSPAGGGGGGLRAGDIIIKLNDKDARTLTALREQVADMIAEKFVKERSAKVLLVVRRGDDSVTIDIPPEPLGVRVLEVQAGIASPLNPPNSEPGSITLAWRERGGGELNRDVFLRNVETDGSWLGWQKRSARTTTDDLLTAIHEVHHVTIDGQNAAVVRNESITFTIRTGDYLTTPAFVLETVDIVSQDGPSPNATSRSRAVRVGRVFRRDLQGRGLSPRECPLTTIIPSAVPLVAAAMPQQKEAVIPLQLMSVRDLIARPGYVLATRGKQALPMDALTAESKDSPGQAWRVDLLHCGVVIESYWLSDDRRLLRSDSLGAATIVSRRVANEREARSSAEENPFRNIQRRSQN
ncbi:MAG: PDZ domain-containing protein [Phycisphaerales bacterium]|nr:PDZ domain-containing protein [Phycisphaerales bacterium]